jgi:hypothetical protein
MAELLWSAHAQERARERGIAPEAVALAVRHGRATVKEDGSTVYRVTFAVARRVAGLRGCAGLEVVAGPDGGLITVYRSTPRPGHPLW